MAENSSMSDTLGWLTEFTPRLRQVHAYPYDEEHVTLHDPAAGTWVRLDRAEQYLVRHMSAGTMSVSQLLQQFHAETGRIAPGLIFELLARLAAADMLDNDPDQVASLAARQHHQQQLPRWRWLTGLPLVRIWHSRSDHPSTIHPWPGIIATVVLVLLVGAYACAPLSQALHGQSQLFALRPWFTSPDQRLVETITIWALAGVLMSTCRIWQGGWLLLFGTRPTSVRLILRFGIPMLEVDDHRYRLLPRFAQSVYACFPLPFYLLLWAWGIRQTTPHAALTANLAQVLLFFELSPLGYSLLMRSIEDLTGSVRLPVLLERYFANKALRFRGRDMAVNQREGVLLLLCCWMIVWGIIGINGFLQTVQTSLIPLFESLVTPGMPIPAQVAAGLVLILLVVVAVGLVGGVYLFVVRTLWRAADDLRLGDTTGTTLALDQIDDQALVRILESIPVLSEVGRRRLGQLAQTAHLQQFRFAQSIVNEGQPNDRLHVILAGAVEIYKEDADGQSNCVGHLQQGDFFGEISVLEQCPATADVVVGTVPCYTASFDRAMLERTLETDQERQRLLETARILHLLGDAQVFTDMERSELFSLVRKLRQEHKPAGTTIVRQGEPGRCFYLIDSGEVDVVVDGEAVAQLGEGQYFGEIALLEDVPRTASVIARKDTQLYCLDRETFLEHVCRHVDAALHLEQVSQRRQAEVSA